MEMKRNEKVQLVDITSMLNMDIQKDIYHNQSIASSKIITEKTNASNFINLYNFKKLLDTNCICFRKFSSYDSLDEVPYNYYDETYYKYADEKDKTLIKERNKIFCDSAYILPMYMGGETSMLHLKSYGGKGSEDSKIMNHNLCVIYDMEKLLNHIEKYAWNSRTKNHTDNCYKTSETGFGTQKNYPVISLMAKDRIFCGGVQYLNINNYNDIFDPSNAVVPLYIKQYWNRQDDECRLCLIRNSEIMEKESGIITHSANWEEGENVYVQVGCLLECITKIKFLKNAENEVKSILDRKLQKAGFSLEFKEGWGIYTNHKASEFQITPSVPIIPKLETVKRDKMVPLHKQKKKHSFGIFCEKYDSMKQSYVLTQGNREYNYRCYNGSLRFDFLLFGKIVLTDAQFYDGMLFVQMIEHGEFEDFIQCVYDYDCLEIRKRTDESETKDFVFRMYGNPFYFSSSFSYEFAKEVEDTMKKLQKEDEEHKKKVCKNIDTFWEYINEGFNPQNVPDTNRFHDKIMAMKNEYQLFDDVYDELFKPWKKIEFYPLFLSLMEQENNFLKVCDIARNIEKICKAAGPSCRRLIDACEHAEDNFENMRKFRTAVTKDYIGDILNQRNKLDEDSSKMVKSKCDEITDLFNYTYNKVLAIQHECRFFNSYIYQQSAFTSNKDEITIKFDRHALDYICNCTWKDFYNLLNDQEISEAGDRLNFLLNQAAYEEDSVNRADSKEIESALENLNRAVKNYCVKYSGKVGEDKVHRLFNAAAKSTEYYACEKLAFYKGPYRFIGNGVKLEMDQSNDWGIFIPNTNEGPKMYHIYFEEKPDIRFNTIVSPIER